MTKIRLRGLIFQVEHVGGLHFSLVIYGRGGQGSIHPKIGFKTPFLIDWKWLKKNYSQLNKDLYER